MHKIKYDYHIHTTCSFDCQTDINAVAEQAIKLGLTEIAITDHVEHSYPQRTSIFSLGVEQNTQAILNAKEKYKDKLTILIGMEFGLRPDLVDIAQQIADQYPFDFIIGSTHDIKGTDFSSASHYTNVPKQQAYHTYFQNMLDVVTLSNAFDVVGHLDYVQRYGTYPDKTLHYKDHSDIIDTILTTLIKKDKGIEVNTSGYRYNGDAPSPSPHIIKRYKELGGTIITLGSDAHFAEHLAHNFDLALDIIKDAGFTHITRFKNRKPYFEKI